MKDNRMMKNVLEWLETSEEKYSSKTAVEDGQSSLTYHGLAVLSEKIGSGISRYIKPKCPVVVFMEKSTRTLAAMFGIAYAGCFYVNVHPGQPPERIKRIFSVLEPEGVVVDEKTGEKLKEVGYIGRIFYIEDLCKEKIDKEALWQIREQSRETDLLYGIFTSGSTGNPKGIVVSHKAVIQFIGHFTELFSMDEGDRIGNQAPFDFDVSVKDIYSSIRTGATLVLIPKELFVTPPGLLDYLCDKEVTTLIWAVSALCIVSSLRGFEYKIPKNIKKVMFSGETMPVKQLKIWQEALPDAMFVNLYGPTEITCNCTYYRIEEKVGDDTKIPIGRAFPGRCVFLLDENRKEIFMTETVGEICVAGESLSEGYYHDNEQSEEKFIQYPVCGNIMRRTYRTGDLGYYGEDGQLYFAGRKDFQIKHMGHRIELEEIERAMTNLEGVARVCCVFVKERNKIVAFYTGDANASSVRKNLRQKLPVYMIPTKLIPVENMPLNKNGKTDRGFFAQMAEGVR